MCLPGVCCSMHPRQVQVGYRMLSFSIQQCSRLCREVTLTFDDIKKLA